MGHYRNTPIYLLSEYSLNRWFDPANTGYIGLLQNQSDNIGPMFKLFFWSLIFLILEGLGVYRVLTRLL